MLKILDWRLDCSPQHVGYLISIAFKTLLGYSVIDICVLHTCIIFNLGTVFSSMWTIAV